MTDAREIIAHHLCEMAAQGWSGISPFERAAYRTTAQRIVDAVTAAGFRIDSKDALARLDELEAERDLLQDILDSRPAINAGLPDSYIRWSRAIYSGDVVRAIGRKA